MKTKYSGASRANRNKILRMEKALKKQTENLQELKDLVMLSDFLTGVAQLGSRQQINLLKFLKAQEDDGLELDLVGTWNPR